MSNDPDQIRRDIEATRSDLSYNVEALTETVKPGNVARRQADKVSGKASDLKSRIMGKADDVHHSTGSAMSSMGDAVPSVGEAASTVKTKTRQQTEGNPLAAGIIALGAGWLLGSLLPASEKEQQAAAAVKDKAQPLVDEAKQMAQDTAAELKEPAKEAVDSVKQSATDAADTVKQEGQSAAQDVKQSAAESKDSLSGDQGSSTTYGTTTGTGTTGTGTTSTGPGSTGFGQGTGTPGSGTGYGQGSNPV